MFSISEGNTHIEDSYKITNPNNIKKYLQQLKQKAPSNTCTIITRSLKSLSNEWMAHNLLYYCKFMQNRTKDVDLDSAKWYTEVGYSCLSCIYRLIWKIF